MTPYSIQNGDIFPEEQAFLRLVQDIFAALPDKDIFSAFPNKREYIISCHHLCFALVHVFNLKMESGYFGSGMEHSWIVLRDKSPDGKIILDVYPVAGTAPFLVYAHWNTPWRSLYQKDISVIVRAREQDQNFNHKISELVAEIKTYIATKAAGIIGN